MKCKLKNNLPLITSVTIIILLGLYNYFNNTNFFEVPIYAVINALIAVIFAFYFTQNKNNRRSQVIFTEKIIYEIKDCIYDSKYISINSDSNQNDILLMQKKMLNKLNLLEIFSIKLKCNTTYIKKIKADFTDYTEFVGEHFQDLAYLAKSENTIKKYLQSIDANLDNIVCELYS